MSDAKQALLNKTVAEHVYVHIYVCSIVDVLGQSNQTAIVKLLYKILRYRGHALQGQMLSATGSHNSSITLFTWLAVAVMLF